MREDPHGRVQHPNADRLRVCAVDTGAGEPVQVVCGAANARAGLVSVFAPPGTYVPGKAITLIQVGTIRGVESSNGMLCSGAELGIGRGPRRHPRTAAPTRRSGHALCPAYAGPRRPGDRRSTLTPNRPDCTSGIHGIARDLAAAGLGTPEAIRAIASGRVTFRRGPVPGARSTSPSRRTTRTSARLFALASGAGRAQRPVAGLDADAGCGRSASAPDQRARGHHQLRHLRPRSAAARVRRGQGLTAPSRCVARRAGETPVRPSTGKHPRARPEDVVVIADASMASSRSPASWAAQASGCDEATTDVLIESGPVGPGQHRGQSGRQARHHHRRALPVRARRRPRLLPAGPGARDETRAGALRR